MFRRRGRRGEGGGQEEEWRRREERDRERWNAGGEVQPKRAPGGKYWRTNSEIQPKEEEEERTRKGVEKGGTQSVSAGRPIFERLILKFCISNKKLQLPRSKGSDVNPP